MAAIERPTLTGGRWSEASRCARMAAISLTGAIPEALPERVAGLWERGHDVEDAYVRRLAAEYSGPIIREHPVPWGDGYEAHVDVLLPDAERCHIEVKSTTAIDKLPGCDVDVSGVHTTSAVLQVVGGAAFDPEGGTAELVTKSPVDYAERHYPIVLTDDLVGVAQEIAQQVVSSVRTGTLPERTCLTPAEGVGKFCQHISECFKTWTPPEDEAALIEMHAGLATLAESLLDVTGQVRVAEGRVSELKEERDRLRGELAPWIATPKRWYNLAGVRLRRRPQNGRRTFSLKDAIAAGLLDDDRAEPFTRVGQPFDLWDIELDDDQAAE